MSIAIRNTFVFIQWISLTLILSACGSSGDSGVSPPGPSLTEQLASGQHIVGPNPTQYTQKDTRANISSSLAEDTGYTLDHSGLVITGSFEGTAASAGSKHYYKFNTSTFDSLSAQVFINGLGQTETSQDSFITLFSAVSNGYSHLTGIGYFTGAWIQPLKVWVIGISTTGNYQIEIVGIK
ncbi:MAG: hypothetical protein JNM39_04515 [Bdellovibrionaceae bacterium]|nr:hypothetical protein [Pseudobdellovibrionaceae bacterium]